MSGPTERTKQHQLKKRRYESIDKNIEEVVEQFEKNLNVRDVEAITKNEKKTKTIKVSSNRYVKVETKLQNKLGCKVKVSEGKITISFPKEDRKEIISKILGDK